MIKKKYLIFSVLVLLACVSNVFAVVGSGTVSNDKKEEIYYAVGENTNLHIPTSVSQFNNFSFRIIGGYYNAYLTGEEKQSTVEYRSNEVYSDPEYARQACSNFTKSKTDYLCNDYSEEQGYVCNVDGRLTFSNDYVTYPNVDTDGGLLFKNKSECEKSCSKVFGQCEISEGYSYIYSNKVEQTEVKEGDTAIRNVKDYYFITKDGDMAFCVQPGKPFAEYKTPSNNPSHMYTPNYCLDETFDLSVCSTSNGGYNKDYRCGLAYILLHSACLDETGNDMNASCENAKVSEREYVIALAAMRMYASYKGGLNGTGTVSGLPNSSDEVNSTLVSYFYGLTAKRVMQDGNYLANGLICSRDKRNIGIMCDRGTNDYKDALKMFSEAINAGSVDIYGNKIPTLITKNITEDTTSVQITNPCSPDDDDCEVEIKVYYYDSNHNKIYVQNDEADTLCDSKSRRCSQEINTYSVCTTTPSGDYYAEVSIKNFEADGNVKAYYSCTNPTNRQIMYVFKAKGRETTDTWVKEYSIKADCISEKSCKDLKKTVTTTNTNINACDGSGKDEYGYGDYNGYDTIEFKDPTMTEILNSSCRENYRRTAYEVNTGKDEGSGRNGQGYCQIYCRNETKIQIANKTTVFSGMQFQYKLEEKIPNSGITGDRHLTSIVTQTTECASLVDYETWKKDYDKALDAMVKAWNDWKGYYDMAVLQSKDKTYPKNLVTDVGFGATCDVYKSEADSTLAQIAGSYPVGTTTTGYDGEFPDIVDQRDAEFNDTIVGDKCRPKPAIQLIWDSIGTTACFFHGIDTYYINPKDTVTCNGAPSNSVTSGGISKTHSECIMQYDISATYLASGSTQSAIIGGYCTRKKGIKVDSSCVDYEFKGCNPAVNGTNKNVSKSGTLATWNSCNKALLEAKNELETNVPSNVPSDSRCSAPGISYKLGGFTGNTNECSTSGGSGGCTEADDGKITAVAGLVSTMAGKFAIAAKNVSNLLKYIQNCDFYGANEWIPTDHKIEDYSIEVGGGPSPAGPGGTGGVSASSNDIVANPTEDTEWVAKQGSILYDENGELIDYNPEYLIDHDISEYLNILLAKTDVNKTAKTKILADMSGLIGSDIELDVSYGKDREKDDDKDEEYGFGRKYSSKNTLINDEDIVNHYFVSGVDVDETIKLPYVICDTSRCHPDDTEVNKIVSYNSNGEFTGDYVWFKATRESDFYRDVQYYAEAYTGKVIESNAREDNKKYILLDHDLYPISKVISGIYPVNYTYSGIPNGSYYDKNGNYAISVQKDTFEYTCAYDVISDKPLDPPSICEKVDESTFVYYTENNVPIIASKTIEVDGKKIQSYLCENKLGYTYRNVDLSNLFPNDRKPGINWQSSVELIEQIQNNSKGVYADSNTPSLSVTLTPESIKSIKEYNTYRNGYQDNSLSACQKEYATDGISEIRKECKSSFITEMVQESSVFGIEVNTIDRGGNK